MSQPGEWTPTQVMLDPREPPITKKEWEAIERVADQQLIDRLSERERHLHQCRVRTVGRDYAMKYLRARKAILDEKA
jgi:hypothetical protein